MRTIAENTYNRITGPGPLAPVIFKLAAPVVLMMYLQGMYNIVDTIWVGRLLGKISLAGIATGGFVLWSLYGMTSLIAVGAAAKISRRLGEGNVGEAETVAAKSLLFALFLSVFFGVLFWFLTPVFFSLMGTGAQVTETGMLYIRVLLLGSPFIFFSFTLEGIFQASGDTVTPMGLMAVSLMLNAALDPVLMIGMFGFPALGVAGAAVATLVSRIMFVSLGLSFLMRKKRIGFRRAYSPVFRSLLPFVPVVSEGVLKLEAGNISGWDRRLFLDVIKIGLPSTVSRTLFPFVYMVITRLPAEFGPEYIAALRIGHTVEGISFFFAMGFSVAASTCVGQNLGAGSAERAEKAAWIAAGVVSLALLLFSVLFLFFPRQIAAVFSSERATMEAAAQYLVILSFSQVFMGLEIVMGGAFSGAGDTVPPMAAFVPLNISRIPAAYILCHTFGLGVLGVWWAISGSSIVKGIVISFWFGRGRWKEKNV